MHDEWVVEALTVFHVIRKWIVATEDKAREYAMRMITEGLWYEDGDVSVFLPVHQIYKVKVYKK